ncbi:MAG: hypothetical protein CMI73_03995 [Candidatus Pelagibacter sp.]|nr:hypothetical protein [Candidatus Pelagibacter sp.]OUV86995.1 MAG: hypothetical protein CBC96_03925 [Pelagibacteraceae bacterium TMED136]|tara:strand:- start:4379 stop:5026 length:648 start_codon:yes stop_codon:yes gene_type:complete
MKIIVISLSLTLICSGIGFSNEKINIFDFKNHDLKKFKSHSIKKKTTYVLKTDKNGEKYLRAEAEGQASGLGREIKINLTKTPYLNITWKVVKGLPGIKENTKKGHDFAARVSVIKEVGSLPWQKKAMNYVFSSNKKIGSHWTGPYRKQIIDYVASSLIDQKLNNWVTVKINVKQHFEKYLNLDVSEIDGVAIMTDTDNSKKKAIAFYKNIYFSN